jgi:hypothetical protein
LFPSCLFTLHGVRQRRITKSISPPNEAFAEEGRGVRGTEESTSIIQLWAHNPGLQKISRMR